ncbi:hypothetical protein AWW66_03415 [Micromonospora rosaria]|uniref:Uncharacterized protein n=1 Tax=Micromonospora rosaria TaxID=47874 RepID=A0A136PY65_9ACTN|nr:hypothetical protein [Micromonospora rosaria]KXK63375.1 hypothetical protein AWW66_03415 [Micromonospora rosaria]
MTDTPIDPARVLAALESLGWPDDREQEQPGPEPVGHFELRRYWTAAENVVRAVDKAGCPCTPSAPEHRHGAGGYCTARPVPDDDQSAGGHVLVVVGDGTWRIDHPADCTVATPTGPAVICLVQDLADELPPATRLPAGRYEATANDLGDRLLIGDRIAEG